jgi:hypothetical protein
MEFEETNEEFEGKTQGIFARTRLFLFLHQSHTLV